MVAKKPKIVVVGAGMAGLTAANRLHTSTDAFDLLVLEAGDRIGGRIRSSEFAGVHVEMGATWIHGIGGSPVYDIARQIGALRSSTPWERMDGFPDDPVTVAEGGLVVDKTLTSALSSLYRNLMDSAKTLGPASDDVSVGAYLRRGLQEHRDSSSRCSGENLGDWTLESLENAVFSIHENTERTYTSADELADLDLAAESEYREFPGEEITIARGYSRVIEHLASALPQGVVRLGRKVDRIEWRPEDVVSSSPSDEPVKVHLDDGSVLLADHVIVTVSLGVLKAGKGLLFSPPLPAFKRDAIGRLGFGVVNKLFMEREAINGGGRSSFPLLHLAFVQDRSARHVAKIPGWIRRTSSICPVYEGSDVLLSWFVGKDAVGLEELQDEEIIRGIHETLDGFASPGISNGVGVGVGVGGGYGRIRRVVRSGWGKDPLFLGSYSYVAVGSSGEDLDLMAEPLPRGSGVSSPQILFAGEATHRTHYSTTHGAYFSGMREANRLLQCYKLL